jgi:hypothetical protein
MIVTACHFNVASLLWAILRYITKNHLANIFGREGKGERKRRQTNSCGGLVRLRRHAC